MRQYTDQEIFEAIRQIIAKDLRVPREHVAMDSLLRDQLGAESLDFVSIEFGIESHFQIQFYHESWLAKLQEEFAPEPLQVAGKLTPFGARVLKRRMPETDPALISAGRRVDVGAVLTPATWVRATRELLAAIPETCPTCGAGPLRPAMIELNCEACGAVSPQATGGDCISAWVRANREDLLQEVAASAS